MSHAVLTLLQARRLALDSQRLRSRPPRAISPDRLVNMIQHLGYVQIDTISVIERAHHHTLWTRLPGYMPARLPEVRTASRRVFEYWGHALSLLPIKDYRYYLPRMERFRDPDNRYIKRKRELCGKYVKPVLERIRAEGPLAAKDIESPRLTGTWRTKLSTGALELLFFTGELMISERRGMERVYDLTERVLPSDIDTRHPTDLELGTFLIERSLQAHGIVTERDIHDHIDAAEPAIISKALTALQEEKTVLPVTIEGRESQQYYVAPDSLTRAKRLRPRRPRLHLLSPFDNSVILRERLNNMFGFDYSLECYTPAKKRKYGHFVLPILWGEDFVGRLDPRADRKAGVLEIKNLWLEDSAGDVDSLFAALATKLTDLAQFCGCERVVIRQTTPRRMAAPLRKQLKAAQ